VIEMSPAELSFDRKNCLTSREPKRTVSFVIWAKFGHPFYRSDAMTLKSCFAGSVLLAAVLTSSAASAALVTNGSFESGAFSGDMNDTMSLSPPSTAMTGWTVTNGTLAWIGPTNTFGLAAQDGGYFLDLTGYHDNIPYGGVTQSIATNIGSRYALTFYLGSSSQYGT
jgi:Protein of unknown function (DUF642)